MCHKEFAEGIDRMIFPGIQGGPLMHAIAAKAVAFKEAQSPDFKDYQRRTVDNARALAEGLKKKGYRLVSGGTDTHLILVDLRNKDLSGKEAEEVLEKAGITVNKNSIPFDERPPFITSGIRLGTPAITTQGMKEAQMDTISRMMDEVLRSPKEAKVLERVRREVEELCRSFPFYA